MHTSSAIRGRTFLPLLCLLFLPLLPAQPPAPVLQLLQSGAEAMRQGRPAEAESFFQRAVAAAPQLPEAYLGLGMCQLREGKPAEAEKTLSQALTLNPNLQGVHLFLGITQYQTNNLDGAINSLQQEVKLQPQNAEALTWLGIVELGAGHPEAAVEPLDRAAAITPKDPNVLDYRGRAHSLVAQQSYRALTALDPDSWRVHRALGEIASESRQWDNAVAEYQKALDRQPNSPDLYEALAEGYQHLSRFDEASRAYQAELKLSPHNPIALYNLGKIQVQNGDAQRGVALLRQAAEAHALAAPVAYYLGLGLAQTGHPDEAATWLEKCLAQSPSEFLKQSAYFQLARVYKTLGRKDAAQHAADELKKLKDAAAQSHYASDEIQ
jgi:tetratricopeptide (TPR) repeat protein